MRDLGVEELPRLTITSHKTILPHCELDVTFRCADEIARAAKVTGDTTLERVNTYTLSFLDALHRIHYPKAGTLKAKTHPLDICDSILNEVHILDAWVNLVEPLRMQQVVLESKQEEMQFILNQQDPMYHPDDSSQASDDIIPVELCEPPSKKPNAVPDPEIVSTRQAKKAEAVTVTVEKNCRKKPPQNLGL